MKVIMGAVLSLTPFCLHAINLAASIEFLSGRKVTSHNPLIRIAKEAEFKAYRKRVSELREKKKLEIKRIRRWEKAFIPTEFQSNSIFAPYANDNFYMIYSIFPRAFKYLLFFDFQIQNIRELKSTKGLKALIREGLYDQLRARTNEVNLAALLIQMGWLKLDLLSWSYIRITSDGSIDVFNSRKKKRKYDGIRLVFKSADLPHQREIYILNSILNKSYYKKRKVRKLLKQTRDVNTFIKDSNYSTKGFIKGILKRSALIFSTPKDIPFKRFKPKKWTLQVYGNQNRDIKALKKFKRPQIRFREKTPLQNSKPCFLAIKKLI